MCCTEGCGSYAGAHNCECVVNAAHRDDAMGTLRTLTAQHQRFKSEVEISWEDNKVSADSDTAACRLFNANDEKHPSTCCLTNDNEIVLGEKSIQMSFASCASRARQMRASLAVLAS